MKRFLGLGLAIVVVLSLVALAGCGGGGSSSSSTSQAAATSTSNGASAAFTAATVTKGAPYKLVFLTQPVGGKAFENLAVAPVVGIMDSDGNIVSDSSLAISVNLTPETAGDSPLSGVQQVIAVNGQATFDALNVQGSGKGFIMVAKSSGLLNAFSQPFDVSD